MPTNADHVWPRCREPFSSMPWVTIAICTTVSDQDVCNLLFKAHHAKDYAD